MYLIRCSLSLLMTGVHVPLHFLHSTFHKVWHISYLVSISHFHNSWNISTVFSVCFVKFLFVSCSDRNLAVLWGYCQPRNPFFFSLVLLVLDLEMGRCPPPYYSFWGHLPSLLLFLKLTSSVTYSTIVVTHLQVQYPQFFGSLAYCHFPTTFLI